MKKILITGGVGFIGSNLIRTLLAQGGYQILCLDNLDDFYDVKIKLTNLNEFLPNEHFTFLCGDITNYSWLEDHIKGSFDSIVHLAAKAGVRQSILNPQLYQQVNVIGTQNLLELAKKREIKKFVFGSSSSVYGINKNVPWVETEQLLPISPYASSKLAAEQIGHVYSHLYGINFVALRFFTVYGPGQRPDLAIHKFTKLIINNEPINMFGDGSTMRDYTYISDIVDGIINACEYDLSRFELINLGSNDPIKLKDLIAHIESLTDKKANIIRMSEQQGDVRITYADITRARELINYSPQVAIQDGLGKFVDWYIN